MSGWQNQLKWGTQCALRRVRRFFCSKLYQDINRDLHKSILVAGTARSGTTWLGDILVSQLRGRMMFEPFHSCKVKEFRQYHYFQYMRPNEKDGDLAAFCKRVFSGELRDKWVDNYVEVLSPQYRIIKEIRANLMLKWIRNQLPQIRLIFLIRHPCAVVLSRMGLNWDTDRDIESFLVQPKLADDFIGKKMDVIMGATSPEEKHAVIWCISNLIPLRQFQEDELNVVYYEHLYTQPEVEIGRLFQSIRLNFQETPFNAVKTPSPTAKAGSAIVLGENILTRWQSNLHPRQIEKILNVVEAFGLEHLYGDSLIPRTPFFRANPQPGWEVTKDVE